MKSLPTNPVLVAPIASHRTVPTMLLLHVCLPEAHLGHASYTHNYDIPTHPPPSASLCAAVGYAQEGGVHCHQLL